MFWDKLSHIIMQEMYAIKLGDFKHCVVPLCERLINSEETHTVETVMAVPTLTCASETWVLTKRSLQSTELTAMRSIIPAKESHIIDKIVSDDISSELGKLIRIQINRTDWLLVS
jgi:hypothetical protein